MKSARLAGKPRGSLCEGGPICTCRRGKDGKRRCGPRCAHLSTRQLCDGEHCSGAFTRAVAYLVNEKPRASKVYVCAEYGGTGLEVRKFVARGTPLAYYRGKLQRKKPSAKAIAGGRTFRTHEGDWLLGSGKDGASAANHACHPNCELQEWTQGDAKGDKQRGAKGDKTFVLLVAKECITGKAAKPAALTVRYNWGPGFGECLCTPPRGKRCCGQLGCTAKSHREALS